MAVDRHVDWGEPGPLGASGIVVHSNAEANAVITTARRSGKEIPELGLAGGDLAATLGGNGDLDRMRSEHATRFKVDLGAVLLDGKLHWFLAHLIARNSLWLGPFLAAMNADHVGAWNLTPRAHPGDGQLDIFEADLSFQERLQARRRLRTGSHVPHPAIAIRRASARQITFATPQTVFLDGIKYGKVSSLSIRVEADAVTVVV